MHDPMNIKPCRDLGGRDVQTAEALELSCEELHALTLRLLMSYIYIYIYIYIYGAPILDVSRSHTMTQHSR